MTPSEPTCRIPKEFMEGEAGFSLLFPAIEGVHIRPFHFCKKSLTDGALEKAGKEQVHILSGYINSQLVTMISDGVRLMQLFVWCFVL